MSTKIEAASYAVRLADLSRVGMTIRVNGTTMYLMESITMTYGAGLWGAEAMAVPTPPFARGIERAEQVIMEARHAELSPMTPEELCRMTGVADLLQRDWVMEEQA